MLFRTHDVIEQLLEDTRNSWEFTLHRQGVVWYSRHCKGGSFESSFQYQMRDKIILNLHSFNTPTNLAAECKINLAQPDSFQLASDFIRKVWNNQQPDRQPIDKAR